MDRHQLLGTCNLPVPAISRGVVLSCKAWVAAHVALAVAAQMMAEGLRYVSTTRGAAGLMQSIIKQAHRRLIEVRPMRRLQSTCVDDPIRV